MPFTMDKVVGIGVSLFLVAILLPIALVALATATLTSVDPAVVTILQVLLPVLAVIGIAMGYMKSR